MNHLESFRQVHTFFFDVDGVLTDSHLLILEDGKLLRRMNNRDLFALKTLVQQEYKVIILSSGRSDGIKERLLELGITDLYLGVDDKLEVYEEVIDLYDLDEEGILYMGDDWPDYASMRRVGMPVCPNDAIPEIIKISKYVSPLKGGAGCVRDVIEKVLRLHQNWINP